MSRSLAIRCTLLTSLLLLAVGLELTGAQVYEYETDGAEITITGFVAAGGPAVIPETFEGLPVTKIGVRAFKEAYVTSVELPGTLTHIGAFAFVNSSLRSITIPGNVQSIGNGAFQGCTSLTSISIPGAAGTVGAHTFADCSKLASVELEEGITGIGEFAFRRCRKLGTIDLPDGLETIADEAFYDCDILSTVHIPASVTELGQTAFTMCAGLTTITVDGTHPSMKATDGVVFDKVGTTLVMCPPGRRPDYVIPAGVTTISDRAFHWCSQIETLTIPAGVTSIGERAFYCCYRLAEISLPSTVETVAETAFESCSRLAKFDVDPASTAFSSLDGILFDKSQETLVACPPLRSGTYVIPESVTRIEAFAFHHSRIYNLTLPPNLSHIGARAFYGSFVTYLPIPDGVTSIGEAAFSHSHVLAVILPPGITEIPVDAFSHTNLGGISVPEGVTHIGDRAFQNCSLLGDRRAVELPSSLTSIGDHAFSGSRLKSLTVPAGVVSLGDQAFAFCNYLVKAILPSTVTDFGSAVFMGCPDFEAIYIKGDVPPDPPADLFEDSHSVTVHYLLGTGGWGSTYAGRPTAPWHPGIITKIVLHPASIELHWSAFLDSDEFAIESSTDGRNWSIVRDHELTHVYSAFVTRQLLTRRLLRVVAR